MDRRRSSFVRRWWLPVAVCAVALVFAAAKLSVRSVATGEALLPVAGAPVLGPAPTPTETPGPSRGRLRVQVLDSAGTPVPLASIEIRDRFNAVMGLQETGPTGEAIMLVPANTGYVITARREGFSPGRTGPVDVVPLPTAAARTDAPPAPRVTPLTVQVRLQPVTHAGIPTVSRLFVGHTTTPRITLIDPAASLLLKHSDPLGQGRITLAAAAHDASKVYASWFGSTQLSVLSGDSLMPERTVTFDKGSISAMAVSPLDGRLWVAAFTPDSTDSSTLVELDPRTFEVTRQTPLIQTAAGLRFRPDGAMLYARHRSSNALSFVDVASMSIVHTARTPQWPSDVAVSPDGRRLYLVFTGGERLVELDAENGETGKTVEVGAGAASVVAHPDGRRVFVVNQLLGSVQVVDILMGLITDLVPVGRGPQAAVMTMATGGLYVANAGSGSVSVVDPDKITVRETLNTGGSPASLVLVENVG